MSAFVALGYAMVGNLKKAAEFKKESADAFKKAWENVSGIADDIGDISYDANVRFNKIGETDTVQKGYSEEELQKQLKQEQAKLDTLRNQAKKAEHDYHYSNFSDEEKLEWLTTEQEKSSRYMFEKSDRGYQSKIDFYDKQKQIDDLTKNTSSGKSSNVIATSLGAIGGGGNVYSSTSIAEKQLNAAKIQQQTLEKIEAGIQDLVDKDDSALMQ